MEFESSGVETGCIEDEEIIQPGCSCVDNRKSSRNKKNKCNQPSRHSWHDFQHVDYGDQPKIQEGCGKKRKIELVEKDGNLQADEIELCRKSLLEAILRLNNDNVDLQSCTLLELVTQLASLSEAQGNVVTKMREKSAEDGEKISDLEKLLMKRKLEIDNLSAGKDELESFLKIEKEKYVNIDNQLKVALHKLEAVSKEINSFPNGNVDNVCELSSLTIKNETLTIVEQDLVSENIDIKIEKCTLQTKKGDEMDIGDAELKEALSKISVLMEENKRLENRVQLQEKNKSYLQKFKEKLVNLEEMLKKNEAELLQVCCDEDNMMCNLSLNKVSRNVKDQSNEPLMVLEHIPGGLNEPSEGTSSSEEICLKNRGGEVSLEEELYSKVNILDCLYNLTEQYSIKLRQEVERAEGLQTELKEALEKITSLAHNVITPTEFEISSKIITTEQSVVAFDAVMEPVQAKSLSLVTVQDTVETTLLEELRNSHNLQNNLLAAANKLDHLSKELEETIAQAQKENEKLRLHLEQEKLKVSAFEFSLEEKNQELEKLMQKEQELQSVLVANDAKAEVDMKTLLSRVADINAQKLEAEEREYKVKCDMKKYEEELTVLESQLEDYKKQTISLTSSNKEFESLISLEKKSSQEVKCQLQVAMDKIGALSKELAHISEKSKSKEEELLIRLNEEMEKVVRMGDEIHSKIVALENLNIVMEEYKLQLNEERTNYKLMEKELKESLAKNAKEINSESTKSFEGHCIKIEKVNIQANAVKDITEVIFEEELHVQKDTFYSSFNGTVEERKLGESLQRGFEETCNYDLANKDSEAGIICESSNQEMLDADMLLKFKEKISILETELEKSKLELDKIVTEKNKFESILKDEGEKLQNTEKELKNALNQIDVLKKDITEATCNDVAISAQLREEMERHKQLKKELEDSEVVVANLAIGEEEFIIQLKEMARDRKNLEEDLKEAREKILSLCEENNRLICERAAREEERMAIAFHHGEKISRLETTISEHKSQIYRISCDKNESEAKKEMESSSEIMTYKERISELERIAEESASIISRLDIEKGELESLLISEKENCQKISSQLSEALANLQNSLEIIPEYDKKNAELEQVVVKNESEISKLGIEKGELESMLISEKENCQKISSQLSEALANLQNSLKLIPEYEKKNGELEKVVVKNESEISKLGIEKGELESMLISEKESCQKISSQLSEALANLEIIPAYEKKITELEDVVARYESEISKLGMEKGELESLLISEKENCQKISSELSEALANLQKSLEIIPEYEKKITELEKVVIKNEFEISKLTIKKGELESMLISEKENCQKISSELSETLANLQSSLELIPGYEKEITKLERVVAMNESEISKLGIEKGELELLLISEKEDCKKTSSELTEALANLENLTKELNESSAKNKDAEELASLLDMETQKVRKLEEEIETKREESLNLTNKGEELIFLLNEEKCRKQELEAKFLKVPSDAINDNSVEYTPCGNEYCNKTEPLEEISGYKKKIVELENLALRNEDDISRLGIEKRELESLLVSEKENHEKIALQLSEALGSLDKITEELNQSSAKQREAEELSSVLEMNIQKISSMEEELETKGKDLQNLTNKLEELTAETSDKILGYERKIGELEELAARNEFDISRLCNEKKELESLLLSEKENHQKLTLQLDEALFNLENVTITLNESSAKNKNVEEMLSQLRLEMQGVRQLEEELNAKKEGLENVNNKLEELTVQLAEEKGRREELEVELQKIQVNELIENSYEGGELCNHADASEKVSGYEQKIVELEETVLNDASKISRLSIEKSELESLLVLEKENSQKIYLELSGALGILDNVTKELNESSAKDKNVEELSSLLDIEKQKVLKLEEELEIKEEDSENLVSKLEELSKCLSDEKRRKEEIEVELEKLLAKVPSENSSQEKQTDVRLCYDEEVSEKVLKCDDTISVSGESAVGNEPEIVGPIVENEELESLLDFEKKGAQKISLQLCEVLLNPENESEKISTYERKIVELEELAVRNAYDISRLVVEKGEIESLLVLEKENTQKISLQLSEALVNLDNITKELNESSAKNMNVEELSSQLDTEILKVREMEEELKTKDVTLAKYSNEQEELTSLLTEEREKVRKLENESERKMEDLEKLSIKAEEYLSQLQDQLVTTENKELEIKDLLAKVSSYEEEAKRLNALEIESRMKNSEQVARISELEVLVEEGKTEISSMVAKNEELESCLNLEKEASHSLSSQLKDALEKIESLFSEIRNISDNCKIQEEELYSNKSAMEKLSEEYGLKLKEEKERSESLDKEMSQILIDLSYLKEEKEHLIAKHREQENSRVVQLEELEALLQQGRSELSSLTSENKQLVASLATKKDQLECIQHQLDCALQEIDNITKKLNELSNQLQSNQNKESVMLSSIKSELESAKCALSVRAKSEEELINLLSVERCRVEDLHNQLSEEMTKREELASKNLELTNSTDVIKQKLALLVEDYTKSSENELKLMATNEQQSAELEVLKVKLNSSELEIQKLETELNSKISDNTKMENRYKELAEQVESLKVLMEQSKSEISSLTLEKDEFAVNLESKNVQLEVVQTQLAGSLQDVDNLMKKLKETSNQLLSKERVESEILISMKAELEQAKYALSVCASSEEELDNLLSLEKNKVNSLCKQLSEEKAKREEVVAKNLELASSLENIKQQLALLLEEHRKSNENELSLITANEELSDEVNRLKANLDSSRLEIEKLEAEFNAKMNDIPIIEKRNMELTEQMEALKNLLEQGKSEISSLTIEKNNLAINLKSKTDQLESVQHQLDCSSQEIDSLTKKLAEFSNQMEGNKDKESEMVSSIKAELESAKCALLVHAKREEELNSLLSTERNKVDDLIKQLKEDISKREEVVNTNLELTTSIKAVEQQLTTVLDDFKKSSEKELKLMASIEEMTAKITELETKLNSTKSENEKLEADLKVKIDDISVSEKRNWELSSLLESSSKKITELETCTKEMNRDLQLKVIETNNCFEKISQLQSALGEAEGQICSMSLELEQAKEHKEIEVALRAELSQIGAALQEANDRIEKISEARVTELENERSNSKKIISKLEEQIVVTNQVLKSVSKLNEGKISALESELKAEQEKFALKMEEFSSLQLDKNELSELLKAEKSRVSTLENKILKDEEKLLVLEEKMDHLKAEVSTRVKENSRLKTMENELRTDLEMERKKSLVAENEIVQLQTSLLASQSKQGELKSDINRLEIRLREEISLGIQLRTQFDNEKKAHSSAKEAEMRMLAVVSAQEKALSLLEVAKEGAGSEIRMLNDAIQEKEKQLKELAQTLEEQEQYSKSMEQTVEKMEHRNNILLDHRIQIQNNAKANEEKLMAEIAKLQRRLDEVSKSGPGKGDVVEFEKDLKEERLRREEVENKLRSALLEVKNYHTQVEEYKKEIMRCKRLIFGGAKGQDPANLKIFKEAAMVDCGVQTVPMTLPQVQNVCSDGNGAGQVSNINLLEQKVKKLEEDKEFLKKLCRRRHEQREELKLQLEALSSKPQPAPRLGNKENLNSNV